MIKVMRSVVGASAVVCFLCIAMVGMWIRSVSALDASFVPQSSVTLTCIEENNTQKKITKFTNNAPNGSEVILVEQEDNGVLSTQELKVGSIVTNTPRLAWYIKGVMLGPWEVPVTTEGKCLTNESAYANVPPATEPKTNLTPYFIGAGSVLVLGGAFLAGRKLGKK